MLKSISQHRFYIFFALLFSIVFCINFQAYAQEDDDPWEVPLNLSRSGAASSPRVAVDSAGDIHVLWREDAVNTFYYAHKEDGQWKNVIPVEVPFGTVRYLREELGERFDEDTVAPLYTPELIASNDGRIHAVWIDGEDNLYHSSVLAGDFDNYESWSIRRLVSQSVSGFSSVVDSGNTIHLIYVKKSDTPDSPAGVYYRRLSSGGENWSSPEALFKSAYYRAASPESLNFKIGAGIPPGDSSGLYVVLDNRPLEEVLLIRSQDRGESWEEPVVIDRRREEDPATSVGPSDINLVSNGEQLHLMWMAGHDTTCQLYHQWSEDDGLTWQQANAMQMDFNGCPDDYWLMVGSNSLLYLLTSASGGSYFLNAWNGQKWSEGEPLPLLSGFEDPATLRDVVLSCQEPNLDLENNLIALGCGSSMGNEDVWIIERALGEEEAWFPSTPPTWSAPVSLVSSENRLLEPIVFSGSENLLHTFWISSGEDDETVSNADIYYTSWNGEDWSRQVPLIHLNSIHVDGLTGMFDREEGLFLLWRDQETNNYFYSAVKSEDILLPAEWSRPLAFPKPNADALFSVPFPFLDADRTVNIIYAVPLNEGRGIYLIRAADNDFNWSEPITVVDAVSENWAMVDNPVMTQTENGDLHVVFTVYSLGPEPVAQALYYTRSEDGGITWSSAELITEGDIRWSRIVGINPQTILITWQQADDSQYTLWSQQSINGGVDWERPSILFEPSNASDSFELITQLPDNPYFVQLQEDENGELFLRERIWHDNAWQGIESFDLETRLKNEGLLDLAGALTEDRRLLAIFNTQTTVQNDQLSGFEVVSGVELGGQQTGIVQLIDDVPQNNLLYTYRTVDLPVDNISESQLSDAEPPVNSVSTTSPEMVSTPDSLLVETMINEQGDIDTENMSSNTTESNSNMVSILTALIPTLLVVLIVLTIGIRRALPKR